MSKTIDEIILSHSTRGMDKLYEYYKKEFCKDASYAFYALERGIVFIYTGFWANGKCETDGPVGAYFLYKAFEKLGFTPIIVSDESSKGFFKGCDALHVNKNDDTKEYFLKFLKTHNPVAHFSIERLGVDANGFYKNASNKDISEFTCKLDTLYKLASTPTFAIGDGGNEIGMGNFSEFFQNILHVNFCVISSDYPIIASVSNWGAYGFIAYLQQYSHMHLLPTFEEVEVYLRFIVSLGATDGLTGKNEMSVDGKGYKIDKEILKNLSKIINSNN